MDDLPRDRQLWSSGSREYMVGPQLALGSSGVVRSLRHLFQYTPFKVAQIYMDGSGEVYADARDTAKQDTMVRRLLSTYGGRLFVHASHAYNFCGTVRSVGYVFAGHEREYSAAAAAVVTRNVASMDALLRRCGAMGVTGVVVHIGSYGGGADETASRELGMAAAAQSISRLTVPDGVQLLLEGSAGDGTKIPSSLPEMALVVSWLDPSVASRVGFCLDTAHLWASGAARFDSEKAVGEFDELVGNTIGWSRVHLVHLNNTDVAFGGRRDHHTSLTEKAAMWDIGDMASMAGLARLLWLLDRERVAVVTETPTANVDACIARAIMKRNA